MKKLLITILALVGFATLAQAQIVRSAVVKKTNVVVEKEKTTAGAWGDEIGRIVHFVGIQTDFLDVAGLDYAAQYRFSPLFSAGVGIWGGYGDWYEDKLGIELRANSRIHPMALFNPHTPYQPFVSLWAGYSTPNMYEKRVNDYGYKPFVATIEAGCDIYTSKRPIQLSLNLNFLSFEDGHDHQEIHCYFYLKGGIKF